MQPDQNLPPTPPDISEPVTAPADTIVPPPPVSPTPTETKKFPVMVVVIVLVLIAILSVLGFLVYQNMQAQKKVTYTQSTTQNPSYASSAPMASADPTANWNQVQTTNWGFKIPSDWNYFTCTGRDNYVSADLASSMAKISVNNHVSECNFDYQGLFAVSRQTTPYTIPTTPPVIPTPDPNNEGSGFYTEVTDKKDIQVDGKTATYQTEIQHGGQGAGTYIRVYVVNGANTDVITLSDSFQKTIFDQILTTFKFNN